MNNSETRIQLLQGYISGNRNNRIAFVSMIGHGTLVSANATNSTFEIPSDKFVVFISRPGYHIALRELKESRMMNLLNSRPKLQQFLTDTLPSKNTPSIVTRSHWNWKRHIYSPGMIAPNMGLELYDNADTSWGRWYNSQCGVRFAGDPAVYGRTLPPVMQSLKDLVNEVKGPAIIFVFGCRGDPQTYHATSSAFDRHGRFGGQNYRLPPSSLVSAVHSRESHAARYLAKRVRAPGLTLRKEKIEPPAKRRRLTTATSHLSARWQRNINIGQFVKSHYRNGMNNSALANAAKNKRNSAGKNYTNDEIVNAIRRLRRNGAI